MKNQALSFGLFVILAAGALSAQGTFTSTKSTTAPALVWIETTLGAIEIAVDDVHAPITSANFLRYVNGGLYDGAEFYRAARPDTYHAVLPNRPPMELIEARLPAGAQAYRPIPLERTNLTGLHHVTGTVAMGRNDDQPDSATADFYILLNDQPSLDVGGKRFDDAQGTAAFGTVVAGMDVVRKINQQSVAPRAATADNPLTNTQNLDPPVRILWAFHVSTSLTGGTFTKTIVNNYPRPPDLPPVELGPNMIGGIVYDITRAPLEGVIVTLTGPALAAPRSTTTDRDGKYQFTDVAPGTYTVSFESWGFKKSTYPNIVMAPRSFKRLDCLLQW